MTLHYTDKKCYLFDPEDKEDLCFVCKYPAERLIVVRQISNMMLVHLCGECMLAKMDDFLLDNTRPWLGYQKK